MAIINEQNLEAFIAIINGAFFDIPDGESQFEIENLVINASLTPERAYKVIGERLRAAILAFKIAQFTILRLQVDIDELTEVVNNRETPPFTLRRSEIDIEEKTFNIDRLTKVQGDALAEINILYAHVERLPVFNRAQFEAAESVYHGETNSRKLRGIVGAVAVAENIKQRNPALGKGRGNDNGNLKPK